jgi:hypothetical protein
MTNVKRAFSESAELGQHPKEMADGYSNGKIGHFGCDTGLICIKIVK